jgi:hypothetical protein
MSQGDYSNMPQSLYGRFRKTMTTNTILWDKLLEQSER